MEFLIFFIESFSGMSIKCFTISFIGLLIILVSAYSIGRTIAKNKKQKEIMDTVNKFNIRFISFLVQLFSITFGLIMYWEYKDINKSNELINSDIFLPIILLILGKLLYILSSFIGKKSLTKDNEINNNRFVTLFVLISLAIIGFMGDIYLGGVLTGIILGRFFWFDTDYKDLIETIKRFKPSKDCLLSVIIPIIIMILTVTYFLHKDDADLYGAFWGMLSAIIISVVFIVFTNFKKLREH